MIERSDSTTETAVRTFVVTCVLMVAFAIAGARSSCVKPLPVPHAEQWAPDYGASDYPALGAARDGGGE